MWIVRRLGALPKRVASPLPTTEATTQGATSTEGGRNIGSDDTGDTKTGTGADETSAASASAADGSGGTALVASPPEGVAASLGGAGTGKAGTRRGIRLG